MRPGCAGIAMTPQLVCRCEERSGEAILTRIPVDGWRNRPDRANRTGKRYSSRTTNTSLALTLLHRLTGIYPYSAKCRADGNHVSVTVLDRDRLVKIALSRRWRGAAHIIASRRKALTSVTFKQSSDQWAHRGSTEPAVAGLKGTAETIALVAAIIAAVAALAGCSNSDCAYYGDPDANSRCVVVGPSPVDGGQ